MKRSLACLFLAIVALSGCNRYSEGEQAFMNACMNSSNGQSAYCKCALAKMEESYSIAEIQKLEVAPTNAFVMKLASSAQACAPKITR